MLTSPSYRGNILTFLLLYVAGGGVVLAISLPYAARYGLWRSILWSPTWFAFAFLRRIGTLEAAISLPVRPFPARAPAVAREEPAVAGPASVLFEGAQPDTGWWNPDWAPAGRDGGGWEDGGWDGADPYILDPYDLDPDGLGDGSLQDDPVPIPTSPSLLFPEDDQGAGDG